MGTLSIPNTFVNGTEAAPNAADADLVNENNAAIEAVINGDLDDDNIDSISESKVDFAGGGHGHTGGIDGKVLTGDALALALDGGLKGAVKVQTGNFPLAVNTLSDYQTLTGFTQIPILFVYLDYAAHGGYYKSTRGLGNIDPANDMYYVQNLTNEHFKVFQKTYGASPKTVYWIAIGI